MNNDQKVTVKSRGARNNTSGVIRLQKIVSSKLSDARELRQNMTVAEKLLWERIRNRKAGGLKFRRQQIIEGFITDFYCEDGKFCVEVDGGVHFTPVEIKKDEHRTNVFKARGIRVLRIPNEDVMIRLPLVINKIILFSQEN
jgi:very-short-patch-repair endonuclease